WRWLATGGRRTVHAAIVSRNPAGRYLADPVCRWRWRATRRAGFDRQRSERGLPAEPLARWSAAPHFSLCYGRRGQRRDLVALALNVLVRERVCRKAGRRSPGDSPAAGVTAKLGRARSRAPPASSAAVRRRGPDHDFWVR